MKHTNTLDIYLTPGGAAQVEFVRLVGQQHKRAVAHTVNLRMALSIAELERWLVEWVNTDKVPVEAMMS